MGTPPHSDTEIAHGIPPGLWRRARSAWGGPLDQGMGPPPPLAKAATWSYAALGILLLGISGVGVVHGDWMSLAVFAPVVLYCAGLAYGAGQLRSRSAAHPASAWVCAPLLLHVLSGASGAFAFLNTFLGGRKALETVATDVAMFGMLFGWVPALVPFCCTRRAGPLLIAAFAGPLALFAVMWVAWQDIHL